MIFLNITKTFIRLWALFEDINQIISSLPPFDKILKLPLTKLDDILNSFNLFFKDGLQPTDYSYGIVDGNFANEYGYGEKDDYSHYYLRLIRFDLKPLKESDLEDNYVGEELREVNRNISAFLDIYIKFCVHIYRFSRFISHSSAIICIVRKRFFRRAKRINASSNSTMIRVRISVGLGVKWNRSGTSQLPIKTASSYSVGR